MAVFIAAALAAILMLVAFSLAMRDDCARVNEKWPSISDDEFVAKCKPGTSRDIALRVRRIVSEQLGVDYDRVHPNQDFVRDLGC